MIAGPSVRQAGKQERKIPEAETKDRKKFK